MIALLLLPILLISFFLQFVADKKVNRYLIFTFSLLVFYYFTFGITDTADWSSYMNKFDDSEAKTDVLFRYLSLLAAVLGYSFTVIFQLHLIVFGFLYAFFVSRFTKNIFLVLIFYLVISYVPLVNQIRYYLALSLFLNSMYLLFCTKRKILSYVLLFFSVLSHSSMLLLCIFPVLSHFSTDRNYFKRIVLASLGLFSLVFCFIMIGISNLLNHYEEYFSDGWISSIFGGLYNVFPYLAFMFFLDHRRREILDKYPKLLEDKLYKLLYRISWFTIIFIPSSLYIQILAQRYVHGFLIVWICFYLYMISFEKSFKTYFYYILELFLMLIFLIYCTYFLSLIMLGEESHYLMEFTKSFDSIDYISNFWK